MLPQLARTEWRPGSSREPAGVSGWEREGRPERDPRERLGVEGSAKVELMSAREGGRREEGRKGGREEG